MQPLIQQINDHVPFSALLLLTDPLSGCLFFHFVKPQRQLGNSARALTLVYSQYFCPLYLNPHHLCIGVPFFLVPHRPGFDCLVLSRGNHFLTTILKY